MTDLRVVMSVPHDVGALLSSGAPYTVSDLDTAAPKLTVNSLTLLGAFHDTVGTDLLFAPDGRTEGVSTKRLVFTRPPASQAPDGKKAKR